MPQAVSQVTHGPVHRDGARGSGALVQRCWLRGRSRPLVRWRRARAIAAAGRQGIEPVAAYLPQRPTWMADRLRLVEVRVDAQYWFSAALVWPRIWLLTGEDFHAPLRSSRARFDDAAALVGWGLLYLVIGAYWWPAAIAGACTALVGWSRARSAVEEFATLIEAAIDVRWRDLAAALGIAISGESTTPGEGALIDDRLRKSG